MLIEPLQKSYKFLRVDLTACCFLWECRPQEEGYARFTVQGHVVIRKLPREKINPKEYAARDHCANGHRLTPENIYQRPGSHGRGCRICKSEIKKRNKKKPREPFVFKTS